MQLNRYEPDDKAVTEFVEWFEREEKENYLHVLEWLVLNSHLALYMAGSPIYSMSPIALTVYKAIERHSPQENRSMTGDFYHAVIKKLRDDGHPERHMKFHIAKKRQSQTTWQKIIKKFRRK